MTLNDLYFKKVGIPETSPEAGRRLTEQRLARELAEMKAAVAICAWLRGEK
jgi:hypothetical protein